MRGIIFRLIEEFLGTTIALIAISLLFAIMHLKSPGASAISVIAVTAQAGMLISAMYVYSRSLWLPVFFHFAWDFAEPTIFGGINPGIHIEKNLFNSKITGSTLLTGGQTGPGNSVEAAVFCIAAAALFLLMARKKGNFISPHRQRSSRS